MAKPFLTKVVSIGFKALLSFSLFAMLQGCYGERVESLEKQLSELQSQLQRQSAVLESVAVAQRQFADQQSPDIKFVVSDLQFEVVEKAFEPLLIGDAKLTLEGKQAPALIFVEWSLNLTMDNQALEPLSFIQRVENGETKLAFTQALPRHNVKKKSLSVKVVPTGWYLGHVANVLQ